MMAKNPKSSKRKSSEAEREALEQAYSGVQPIKKGLKSRGRSTRHKEGQNDIDQAEVEQELLKLLNCQDEPMSVSAHFNVQWDVDGEVTGYRKSSSFGDLRLLSHKNFEPEAKMDLHGMRTKEVEPKITAFVRNQYHRGARKLLFIHGKGKHSEDGVGVLSDSLVKTLTTGRAARYVRAFCTASHKHGGTGAIVVLLVS